MSQWFKMAGENQATSSSSGRDLTLSLSFPAVLCAAAHVAPCCSLSIRQSSDCVWQPGLLKEFLSKISTLGVRRDCPRETAQPCDLSGTQGGWRPCEVGKGETKMELRGAVLEIQGKLI